MAVAFIVPAVLWLTPRYGSMGAAWAWVSLNVGYVAISVHFMYRRILKTEKWCWYRQDLLYPLMSALVMIAIIRWLFSNPVGLFPQLVTLALASLCSFFGAILGANRVREQAKIILVSSLNT
ncbi:polysaccharide biosynthesis C-terminal domain-containing protein [Laspinema sp. D1]|nr:polysaccharide biosynthesis C-terminal domain-containing protein [Laspinema sp. D2b]